MGILILIDHTFLDELCPLNTFLNCVFVFDGRLTRECLVKTCPEVLVA